MFKFLDYPEDNFDEKRVQKTIILAAVLGIGTLIFLKKRMRKKKKGLADLLYRLKDELKDLME
jgi:hypothetical protein